MTSKSLITKLRAARRVFIAQALRLGLLAPILVLGTATAALLPGGTPALAQQLEGPVPKTPEPVVPALENPVTGIMETGRIIVTVSATRKYRDGPSVNYGYRTGQLIPVTVVISADTDVLVDIGALSNKTISKDPSDFELVAPPVVSKLERNGKKITVLQLIVRTWNMDPALNFNCQFHYAVALLPDGKTPAWKVGTTPDFVLTTSRTATESSKQLLDGDMKAKQTPVNRLAKPLKYTGILVSLIVPFWLLWQLWLAKLRANRLNSAQRAWLVIDNLVAKRQASGMEFDVKECELIAATLRQYLDIEEIPTGMANAHLDRFFTNHERKADMLALSLSALGKLDRAVYGKVELTRQECDALISEIEAIVPRQ